MDKENKFWLSFTAVIVLGLCLFSGILYHYYVKGRVEMAKQGYEQVMDIGHQLPIWKKIK